MDIITTTVFITVGLSWYGGDFIGQQTACGDIYSEELGMFAAVPIEWMVDGYVHCGDTAIAIFSDGRRVKVPIRDTGCHLHYNVYDTGLPFGADFSIYGRDGAPTGTGLLAVRHRDGRWWEPPPMIAWGLWCDAELTSRQWVRANDVDLVKD